jgi:hypothetical protein
MGWPRKNESCRLYFEKGDKSYMLVIVENGKNARGHYEVIANFQASPLPCLCSSSTSDEYLRNCCRRVSWSDLPRIWQNAFLMLMDWDAKPEEIRGFWKMTTLTPKVKV